MLIDYLLNVQRAVFQIYSGREQVQQYIKSRWKREMGQPRQKLVTGTEFFFEIWAGLKSSTWKECGTLQACFQL